MSKPYYWDEAIMYLSQKDEILYNLILKYNNEHLVKSSDPFTTLLRAIIGQQISVIVADSTWRKLHNNINEINPYSISKANDSLLKEIGLSRQKINYFKNVADYFLNSNFNVDNFSHEQILTELMKIKGVGRWTAEMFLIFHLNSPDVLPLGDVGLIRAIEIAYNFNNKMSKEQILERASLWKPYGTIATWYLWRSLDPLVINY